MHESAYRFAERVVREHGLAGSDVVELGSMDVNGSVRPLFAGGRYVGIDLRDGPGVDVVANTNDLWRIPTASFGVAVCMSTLEHDLYPWRTLAEAHRLLAPGGTLILTTCGFEGSRAFPEHHFPDDFYRFSVSAMVALLADLFHHAVHVESDPGDDPGVFAWAVR